MAKQLNWGVLGYARIAINSIIPAILKSSNAHLYGVASRSEDKLQNCKDTFNPEKTYTNYDDLLDDDNIDVVYIPLPNALHKEYVIKAANKGKHILCEKPMALNSKECLEMIEACKSNNVFLMEGFMYRYTDRIKKVQDLLSKNSIGEIKRVNSTFAFYLDREGTIKMDPSLGGGSLYDVGCYPLNFVQMVTQSNPIEITGNAVMNNGVDTTFCGVLKYDNGIIATIQSSFEAFDVNDSEIIGTKGIIKVPDTFKGNSGHIQLITHESITNIAVEESDRYTLEVEDFSSAIINFRAPFISIVETYNNMSILDNLLSIIPQ
ncbi:putative dehydrogenase [Natranaerovirga hydrolytica]|uniref:Putative dehydrogenase n=1 Tax=Natranaerovirga hydrolytica TaxID=680378 RepID=A0A4V2PZ04_9FIRM|nr:Gfo/Idh/MocA family oxidoreductase [Natranaerovirga hydrolytica]TCK87961.1 putative dehydrogenase [Natranaerovirga hydrolytica]